jgi:MFS family permease
MSHRMLQRRSVAWVERAPHGQFWIYFFSAIFFNFGFSVFFFLFNLYLLGTGFNERSLGFIGSAMAVGTLCGTLPVGVALGKYGLRWTLMFTIALACLASIMRVLFVSATAQMCLAVLSGVGLCAWGVCLSPTVASLTTDKERQMAFSITFASGIGVAGLGALAAGNVPTLLQRFHLAVGIVAAEKTVLLMAVTMAGLSLWPIASLSLPPAPLRLRLVRPNTPFLRTFLPAIAMWSLVTGALPPFASVFFVHHLGLSLTAMGSILSLSQLVSFGAILFAPLLFRWTGLANGLALTQLTTAGMLISLTGIHTSTWAGGLYCGYIAAQCMNEPGIYGLLMSRVPPADRSGASSYTFFVTAASQIVASTAVGMLIVHVGYSAVLFGAAGLAVVATILFRRLNLEQQVVSPIDVSSALATD